MRLAVRYYFLPVLFLTILAPLAALAEALPNLESNDMEFAIITVVFVVLTVTVTWAKRNYRNKRMASRDEKSVTRDATPWRKKKKWASGKIESNIGFRMKILWAMGIFLGLLGIPVTNGVVKTIQQGGSPGMLVLLLFPVIGIVFLVAAVRYTIRWKRYGRAFFNIHGETGAIGGKLAGSINAMNPVQGKGDFLLKLDCTQTETRSKVAGKGKETVTTIRWSSFQKISPEKVNLLFGLPVSIEIPESCSESDDPYATGRVTWLLSLSEPSKGVDYFSEFEVPVYRR